MDITPEMQKLFNVLDDDETYSSFDVVMAARQLRSSFRPKCPITEAVTLYENYEDEDEGEGAEWTNDLLWAMSPTGRRIILEPAPEGQTTGVYRWEES